MAVPDAILSAFVEAKGTREATREIAKVQEKLREATKDARIATAAVQRFGRLRGTAVLRVDASKAHAETAAATKAVSGFDGRRAVATLHVDSRRATEAVRENGRALDANGVAAMRMVSAVASTGGAFAQSAASTRTASAATGEHAVMLLRAERAEHAVAAAKTAGVAADVNRRAAVHALTAAQARHDAVTRNSTATDAQKQAASLALERAQVRLTRSTQQVAAANIRARQAAMGHASALHDLNAASRAAGGGGRDGGNGMRWFVASFSDLPGRIYLSTRLLGALMNILMTMAPVLVGLAAQLIAVVSALGPLVGLAAGAAGAMVAAAQGFGVFKLATMGVADALKEQMKVADGAGAAALTQAQRERSAAQAITGALEAARGAREGVRRASEALTQAQRAEAQAADAMGPAYREATRWLRDLRDAQISSTLSLREARFAAKDARDALRELLAGPSPRVLADAHRDVTDALRGERDAARALIDAQRDLNDLLAPPALLDAADAHDAVADATRDETRAQLALARQIKATNAALADPGASEADKAAARLALADAENAVGDAARQSARAQERLRALEAGPTQDAIAQARQRVKDAEQAVTRAKQDTIRAQQDLRAAESPASSDEIARARLAVAQAEHALSVAVRDGARASGDYAAAQRAGLANAPALVAAREALRNASAASTQAERALIEAQRDARIATAGVGRAQQDAALSAQSAAVATGNLSEKFDALPAPAQAFVRQLQAMKPRLDELRQTAAAGFFPGATEGLRAAMGSFSSVNKVVGETSTVLGEAARKSGELVGSPAFGKDIEIIGGRNAKVIDTLGEALRHIISAFRHVLVAAGPLTQWLADVANKWALNAAEAAKAGRESGKMADFFDRARETAKKLGSILGNLGSGLFGVGKASAATGRDILDSLDRITARFAAWANSAKGRNEIAEFMEKANNAMKALGPGLAAIITAFVAFSTNVLPVYAAILGVLAPLMDELVTTFLLWKLAATGAAIATTLLKGAMAVAAFVTGGWTTAFWALNAALAANPIGLIVVGLAALVAALVLAYRNSETFREIVDAVFSWLKTAAGDVFGFVKSVIVTTWNAVSSVTSAVWGAISGTLGTIWGALKTAVTAYFNAYRVVITTAWDVIKAVTSAVWDAIKTVLTTVWNAIKAVAGVAWDAIKAVIIGPIRAAAEWLGDRFTTLKAGLGVIWGAIKSVAGTAWGGIETAIINPIRDAVKFVKDKIGDVADWLANKWDTIKDAATLFGLLFNNKMARAFGGVANTVIWFINKIIGAINKIPGVDIGTVDKVDVPKALSVKEATKIVQANARGGTFARTGADPGAMVALARGGAFGATGGLIDRPLALFGEEAPSHREWVIPENPAYRGRAQMLAIQAAQAVGVPGFAEGGVVDAFRGAIKKTDAGPKASLALWMAGIVESGLRNLSHGHSTSTGPLQLLASTAANMGINARDPFAVAMGFLTRGYWGKGSAMQLAARNPGATAGWVAQQTQGSAFPGRYDLVRDQALHFFNGKGGSGGGGGGSLFGKITGAVGDLLSKGAGFILDKLPGVGDLPDWLQGMGKHVLGKAGDYIKDAVAGLVGSGGGQGGGGVMTGTNAKAAKLAAKHNATITSGYRDAARNAAAGGVAGSSHMKGSPSNPGAHDFVPASQALLNDALKMGAKWVDNHDFGSGLHSHVSWFKKGGMYGPYGVLDSFKNGTSWVPRTGPYELHRGEAVVDRATNRGAPGVTARDVVEALRDMDISIYVGGEKIDERIDVKIERDGRDREAEWHAGVAQ